MKNTKNNSKSSQTRYQSLYLKKIQTQTSTSNEFSQNLNQITHLLQSQIKRIHKSMNKKHIIFSKTIRRKIDIENQQEEERQRLKTKIQQKMRKSSQKYLQIKQKSTSSISSRLKAEKQKVEQIKKLQRTIYNQNFQKSKQMRTATQRFFIKLEKQKRSTSRSSKDSDNLISSRKNKQRKLSPLSNKKMNPLINNNFSQQFLNQRTSNKRQPFLSFLKTPQQIIVQKQKKKMEQQKQKQKSFLQTHVQKLQLIQLTRNKNKLEPKLPTPTIAKIIKKDFNQEQYYAKRKNHRSFVQQSITNKQSFSEAYQQKLQDKKLKKSFFLSQSIKQGDKLLDIQLKQSNKLKMNKILKQSQNQLIRKGNFRYMEKYLQNLVG